VRKRVWITSSIVYLRCSYVVTDFLKRFKYIDASKEHDGPDDRYLVGRNVRHG
jgi:hypothetical protein